MLENQENLTIDDVVGEYAADTDQVKILEKQKTSIVWQYFTRIQSVTSKLKNVSCNMCSKKLSFNGSTTTNLLKHLNQQHKDKLHTNSAAKKRSFEDRSEDEDNIMTKLHYQTDIRESFANNFSDESFQDAVIRLIIKQDESFLLVESREFQKLVSILNRKAKLFKADALKNKIMALFAKERGKCIEKIKNIDSMISFTTDVWTAPTQVPYLGITAHYIDKEWDLHCVTLDFEPLKGSHTGERLADAFYAVVQDKYNITVGKMHGGITLDNASNNDKFIELYGEKTGFDHDMLHFRCFAHVLNLAVQAALSELKDAISVLRNGVRAIRISPLKLERLEKLCGLEADTKFVKPVLDVPTRWNSTYDMLCRALRLQKPLQIMFTELQRSKKRDDDSYCLEASDWDNFLQMAEFLKKFKEACEVSCGDKYPSVSVVVPLYNTLLDHVSTYIKANSPDDLNEFSSAMFQAASSCHEVLVNYYDVTSDACTVATVLDPRLKLEYYQTDEEGNQESVGNIKKVLTHVFRSYVPNDSSIAIATFPAKNTSILSSIYKKKKIVSSVELEEYLKQPTVSMNTNPLKWWKVNEEQFPNLAMMARDYLAIPGTSASSERLFSSGRQLITDFRCSLSPSTIQACMCLKNWLE